MKLRNPFKREAKSPLLEELMALNQISTKGQLSTRQMARLIVETVRQDVTACLREQRHLFTPMVGDSIDRRSALENLARTLTAGEWAPIGIDRAEIDQIPPRILEGLTFSLLGGAPVGGYEERIYRIPQDSHGELPNLSPLSGAGQNRQPSAR